VLPKAELLAKADKIAQHFGLNNGSGWKQKATTGTSPLGLRVTYSNRDDEAVVGLDATGQPLFWHAPKEFKPTRKFATSEAAANDAFQFLAPGQAAAYRPPVHSAGDESNEEAYEWRKPAALHSDVRDRIKIVARDGVIQRAEHRVGSTSEDDDESDGREREGYWEALDVSFALLCITGALIILGIYLMWLTRKSVSHQFPLRLAGVALVLMAVCATSQVESIYKEPDSNPIMAALFIAVMVLGIATVGRGISSEARAKWMSLEQLCFLAPLSKSLGASILAGLLFSPLLVAVPFLIAGSGLLSHASVLPHNVDFLYSAGPLRHSLNMPAETYLLGFFGFALPALARLLRKRWLLWPVLLPVGISFFSDQTPVISGPLAAPLLAGLATFGIFWFVYARFDLLAVITLQYAAGILLTLLMLGQKNMPVWTLILGSVCLLAAAYAFHRRGNPIAEGDPLANIPALSGFRAEREKLQAEFSIARRAQQDMLPQTPPLIPGYSLAASCTPSLEVGGDLYDFLKLPDGRIGIGVADVSGKGVPAALYMTLTKGLLSAVTKDNSILGHVVQEVNRHLHSVTRKKVFVTMALGFLDVEKRLLECVRAGHNPVVWRQAAQNLTTLVSPNGLGLGITAGRIFSAQLKVAEMALGAGDAVVFYSDGITEAMNSSLEQFGEQRLMDAVERADALDAAAARDSILAEVRGFLAGVHPQDDMTIVVLRVNS